MRLRNLLVLASLVVVLLLATVLPLVWLKQKYGTLSSDPAWHALDMYSMGHNGDKVAAQEAKNYFSGFLATELPHGAVRFSELSPTGACWAVTIGKGPSGAPIKVPRDECP